MKNETIKQREQRKAIWMERATAYYSSPQIIKEASDKFDKANGTNHRTGK